MKNKLIFVFFSLAILLIVILPSWLLQDPKWHRKVFLIETWMKYSNHTPDAFTQTTQASTFGPSFLRTIQVWNTTLPDTISSHVADLNPLVDILVDTGQALLNEQDKLIKGAPLAEMFACPAPLGPQHRCQYYQPDWVGRSDTEQLLKDRIGKVRERCREFYSDMFNASLSRYGKNTSNKKLLTHKRLLKSGKLHLAFCWMPKMGSTFWKKAWGPLTKAASTKGKPGASFQGVPVYFSHANPGYTVYSIARSPWDRLVSVYREKCEKNRGRKCQLKFGKRCHVCPTFKKFVLCIVSSMEREWTEFYGHVDTTYNRCGVCDFPYRYIVLMENMIDETSFLLKQHGVRQPQVVMETVRNKTIRGVEKHKSSFSYTSYWKGLPERLIDRVRFFYRYELYLYGYPETPFHVTPPI
ncbi:carbohydrate sulfotransferase 13-like [Watersipora subatra]|uniref:carbohydrate sulfotransferase 13-like n=1 Tax=Watersipora subatra TaxID=2589382 RepID=UPI00355BEA21